MDKKTFLCVACDTLLTCITLCRYEFYVIYIWMIIVYLSILYVYEMKCVVVYLYPCYIDVILCIFTI
jgi:hypothetical protein